MSQGKVWYLENRERVLKENKEKYRLNKDSIILKRKQYREKNKELFKQKRLKYEQEKKEQLSKVLEKKYCECGCGQITNIIITKKQYARFISGHDGKLRKTTNQEKIEYQKEKYKKLGKWFEGQTCKCGCLQLVTPGRIFITGHNCLCSDYHTYFKGKTFEQFHGKEKATNIKIKMKKSRSKQITPIQDTSIEKIIQQYLKELNINFYTHQYIKEIEHGYQCDIFIPIYNLVIECDGMYWHNYPNGREIDKIRTNELLEKGFKVLRLWESEIQNINSEELQRRILLCISAE